MDSGQQSSSKMLTNNLLSKPPKIQQDPTSIANRKLPDNEDSDVLKTNRTSEPRRKMYNLSENVKLLRNRTKQVKSKLEAIKTPRGSLPPQVSTTKKETDLTEKEILQKIDKLQELVQEMRIKKSDRKGSETANSIEADENDSASEKSDGETVESEKKPMEKRKRRRIRKRNRKKNTDEKQLQNMYEKHINWIISDGDEKLLECPDLQFKLGDDLEKLAQKCVEAGLGRIIEGEVRVSAKNNHQAFITMAEGRDAIVSSMAARKYAMDGDVVRAFVRINPDEQKMSPDNAEVESIEVAIDSDCVNECKDDVEVLKKTEIIASPLSRQAFVIRLIKEIGNRLFVGSISFNDSIKLEDGTFFKLKPRDMKVPMIYIPVEQCEEVLTQQKSDDVLGFLFLAQISEIKDNGRCIGKLHSAVGKCGNLQDEIKAILLHNGLKDVQPFEERFEQMWDSSMTITEADLLTREDLRKECIFTIDPLTARDLDDAMSCKTLDNGHYEIGVHISDVTRFLEESSELDELVKLRATSIYLVNEVIHMLPKTLCMKCSLLPNDDKYAFSVFWVMDDKAQVISTRFARSVIRSCSQLAYEHAQKIIDNPDEAFTVDDFPTICNGFTVADIVQRVLKLNSLATLMRHDRFENGSLSIDKPQFYFQFDPQTGEPLSYEISSRLTANYLIEEFMLLANQSVAQFIYQHFPNISFLRNHQPPKPSAIRSLMAKLTAMGIDLDFSSSKSIYDGMKRICGESCSPEVVSAGMNYLLTKPMMRARYFCSENVDTEADLRHYALAIPIYTHFTSPIRRYPDILVHRLLSAALGYTTPPKRTPEELHDLAQICNDQKLNAKNAGEESVNLYFKRYVKAKKTINVRAVVTDIYRHSIEVISLETGHLITIQFKLQKVIVDASKAPTKIYISEKNSTKPAVELRMFSSIAVKLTIWEGKLTGFFITPDRQQRVENSIADTEILQRKRARDAKRSQAKTLKSINAD